MTSLSRRRPGRAAPGRRSLALTVGTAIVAIASVMPPSPAVHAGAEPAQPVQLTSQQKAEFIRSYEALPKVNVPLDAGGAKVLVVKFNDYQCPPCRQSFYDYKPIFAKYAASKQVKFVLKHFPLERECNAAVGGDLHLASCEAAAAVVLAQSTGPADKLEEWFFGNQASLTPEAVRKATATVAGIADFDAQYARALTLVRTDAGLGALLGAKSTPTFFIN